MSDISKINDRFQSVIKPRLRDELSEHSYKVFIDPLEVVGWDKDRNEIVLMNKGEAKLVLMWTKQHYSRAIREAMEQPDIDIKFTNRRL